MTQPIYEVIEANGISTGYIKRTDENGQIWWIPMAEDNSDYQAYLATLAANSAPTAQ